ncbi:hypothetical protein GCM10023238_38130 [Streptomyces heliomycini]
MCLRFPPRGPEGDRLTVGITETQANPDALGRAFGEHLGDKWVGLGEKVPEKTRTLISCRPPVTAKAIRPAARWPDSGRCRPARCLIRHAVDGPLGRRRPEEGLFHAQMARDAEAMPRVRDPSAQPAAHRLGVDLADLRERVG